MNIDEVRKKEKVCKNYQIYVDKDFENKVIQYSILSKTGNKDKQTQKSPFYNISPLDLENKNQLFKI